MPSLSGIVREDKLITINTINQNHSKRSCLIAANLGCDPEKVTEQKKKKEQVKLYNHWVRNKGGNSFWSASCVP